MNQETRKLVMELKGVNAEIADKMVRKMLKALNPEELEAIHVCQIENTLLEITKMAK